MATSAEADSRVGEEHLGPLPPSSSLEGLGLRGLRLEDAACEGASNAEKKGGGAARLMAAAEKKLRQLQREVARKEAERDDLTAQVPVYPNSAKSLRGP
eukprot:101142-Rhodomonas_salina.1